jgi:hypothetical protein
VAFNSGAGYINSDSDTAWEGGMHVKDRGPFNVFGAYGCTMAEMRDGTAHTVVASEILVVDDDTDGRGCWGRAGCAMFSGYGDAGGGSLDPNAGSAIEWLLTPNVDPYTKSGWVDHFADHPIFCSAQAEGQPGTVFKELDCHEVQGLGQEGGVAARSAHPAGVNCALGDASVRFVRNDMDRFIWRNALTIDGEEATTLPD